MLRMSTFLERLEKAYKREQDRRSACGLKKLTKTDIWKAAGASSGAATHWFSGANGMDLGTCVKVAPLLQCNPFWLFDESKGMDDDIQLSSDTQTSSAGAQSPGPTLINLTEHPDLCPIKRVNFKLAAGVHGYALEVDNGDAAPVFFRKDWIKMNGYNAERLVAFRVKGQSMEPSLWDGDLVVVNLADTKPYDGDVYAVSYEGEPGVKRLRRDAGEWWLASDNADQRKFSPKRCTEEVEILGRVIYKQSERI